MQTDPDTTGRIATPPFHGVYPNPAKTSSGELPVIEYTLQLPMPGDSDGAWAAAEQSARSKTYDPEQQFTADALYQVPPDPMHARTADAGPWRGSQHVPLDALRPAGARCIYVLGGCAISARVGRAPAATRLADRFGHARGKGRGGRRRQALAPAGPHRPGRSEPQPAAQGEVREILAGVRPTHPQPTIPQDARSLPLLGRYDVIVIGGGTSGAPAGIASARQGAKTLLVEHLHGLGGVGTMGAISSYYWGNRVGFTATVPGQRNWVIEQKMQWWREELLKASAEIWFGLNRRARASSPTAASAAPWSPLRAARADPGQDRDRQHRQCRRRCRRGRGVYLHRSERIRRAGHGRRLRNLCATYANTDSTITDETDLVDVWQLFVYAKEIHPKAFDQGSSLNTRERRRIVGDETLNDSRRGQRADLARHDRRGLQQLRHPRLHDRSVPVAGASRASRHLREHPAPLLRAQGARRDPRGRAGHQRPSRRDPAGADAGRVHPGYAEGVAAAMTARTGSPCGTSTSTPCSSILVRTSATCPSGSSPTPIPIRCRPRRWPRPWSRSRTTSTAGRDPGPAQASAAAAARAAYARSTGKAKLAYAQVLAVLSDPTGADTLIEAVRGFSKWDEGWDYHSMGQFGLRAEPARRPDRGPGPHAATAAACRRSSKN